MFGGVHPLLLRRWHPCIKFDSRRVNSVHLWITLPELSFQFWSEDMSRIVSMVGKPLATDTLSAGRKRMSYPRVLVEVSADKPLKEKVILGGPFGKGMSILRRSFMSGNHGIVWNAIGLDTNMDNALM